MGVPPIQQIRVAAYLFKHRLLGRARYPLVLMLEPLFQCNLACAGCGKIDHPGEILAKRLSVEDSLRAVDECGAPVVSIPGGEPLLHEEMPEIVRGIVARKKFVYLCTNALLLARKMHHFEPSPYLTFSIHLDGNRARHDASVCREGVYDRAVAAIELAVESGFRVTINCTLFAGDDPDEIADFFDDVMEMGVEGITVSPGYSYSDAPRRDVFLDRRGSTQLFRRIFEPGRQRRRRWCFNQSSLFLDFLAGNRAYRCTPWSTPTYNVFGWQRPCYLLADGAHTETFRQLMETTTWNRYGAGSDPRCDNCMAHCGYEGTAVDNAVSHPLRALKVALRGPRTTGPMVPDPPIQHLGGQHGSR